jgi:Zn-dependent protease
MAGRGRGGYTQRWRSWGTSKQCPHRLRRGDVIGWSLKVGRVLGADVRIHWLFLALLAMFGLRSLIASGVEAMAFSIAFILAVFLCVFLHEVGHTIAGIRAGGRAEQILIWPLGGLAEVHDVPPFPGPQIRVFVSGPLVNLILATALLGVLVILEVPLLHSTGHFTTDLLLWVFWTNVMLFGFNLLPALPLDGGNIFRWGLTARNPDKGYNWATLVTVKTGKVIAVLLGVGGFILLGFAHDGILLVALAVFIYLFTEREKRMLEYASMLPVGGEFQLQNTFETQPEVVRKPGFFERRRERRKMRKREREVQQEVEMRKRVDALLDKIAKEGLSALSEKEKTFLKDASKRYQKNGASH